MRVINHRLCRDDSTPYDFADVINYDRGPQFKFRNDYNQLEYIVMHATVSGTLQSAHNTFDNPQAKTSAHLIIDRDGIILQCVPFDTFAWHTGDSQWADRGLRRGGSSLHRYSIGIEMVNWGPGFVHVDGGWRDDKHHILLPEADAIFTTSKHGYPALGTGWQAYPQAQVDAAYEAVKALMDAYKSILDIVGHEDIKKAWVGGTQKFYKGDERGDPQTDRQDPGPAFPMADFRARLLGLAPGQPEKFQAILSLVVPEYRFLCKEPGLAGRKNVKEGPRALRHKEIVDVIERKWWWAKVRATDAGGAGMEGWLPERYLKRVPPPAIPPPG